MTEADKANEGREEKQIKKAAYKFAETILGHPPISEDDTIVVGFLAGVNHLRDQLSKERETVGSLEGLVTTLHEKLNEEREMRKELVENAIATLCSKFPEYGNREFSVREIRALLEPLKATELDKK